MSESIGNAEAELRRFPCKQMVYTKYVGKLLPNILEHVFNELGFRAEVNQQQANGVDLEVFLENNLILVAEVVNWSIGSRLTNKRKNSYIRNLNEYNCNKVLIYTVPLSNLDDFREHGIHLLEIGYQVLPKFYYDFFQSVGRVIRRKIDSRLTRKEIKSKIREYVDNMDNNLFVYRYFKFLLT